MKLNLKSACLFSGLVLGAASTCIAQVDGSQLQHNGPLSPITPGGAPCGSLTDYQQPLDTVNFNTARTSDEEASFTVFEDFVSGAVITPLPALNAANLRVWGATIEFDPNVGFIATCLQDNANLTPFNVAFFADNAGQPGALIGSAVATPSNITDTGIPFAFTTVFEWDLTMPAIDVTGAAWVSVQRQTGVGTGGGNQCLFLWLDELTASYDDTSIQNDGVINTVNTTDHVFCLGGVSETDMSINKTAAVNGDQVIYTLAVSNNGPIDATNVVVTDALPAEVTYVSDDCGGSNVPPFTWNVGNMPNGANALCNITVSVNAGVQGTVFNTASVSADQSDPTPANNSSTNGVVVGPPVVVSTLSDHMLMLLLSVLLGLGLWRVRQG